MVLEDLSLRSTGIDLADVQQCDVNFRLAGTSSQYQLIGTINYFLAIMATDGGLNDSSTILDR